MLTQHTWGTEAKAYKAHLSSGSMPPTHARCLPGGASGPGLPGRLQVHPGAPASPMHLAFLPPPSALWTQRGVPHFLHSRDRPGEVNGGRGNGNGLKWDWDPDSCSSGCPGRPMAPAASERYTPQEARPCPPITLPVAEQLILCRWAKGVRWGRVGLQRAPHPCAGVEKHQDSFLLPHR